MNNKLETVAEGMVETWLLKNESRMKSWIEMYMRMYPEPPLYDDFLQQFSYHATDDTEIAYVTEETLSHLGSEIADAFYNDIKIAFDDMVGEIETQLEDETAQEIEQDNDYEKAVS